ncbi:MAG TPA: uroporphyrinogen-III synthase [Candidatus Acidoferrales bacterium]|nr:uroporphyrinogen-III synthase [Candidatus Acidoferrales bacterium]
MSETKSSGALAGKRIAVTRAPEQAAELARLLTEHGAEVLLCPLVAFERPTDSAPLDAALERLGEFDWLLFTSQNAVRFFEERRRELGIPLHWGRPRVAVVGPATAKAAREMGYGVGFVAQEATGRALAEGLAASVKGSSVLMPRSDHARYDLPEILATAGARVTDVVAYRTVAPVPDAGQALERIRAGDVDVVALASPSAFERLAEELGMPALVELTARVALAAIGPVTAAAIRQAGLPVAVVPAKPDATSLVEALAAHFAAAPGAPRA